MTNTTNFFRNFRDGILHSINTAMPARVLEYNPSTCVAKVLPLFMVEVEGKNPRPLPPINNVPALKQKYSVNNGAPQEYKPVYNIGDIVLLVFSQRALDDAQKGKLSYPGKSRILSIHDAVIVGVF